MDTTNYFDARDAFRTEATRSSARISAHPIHARGPNGEKLFVDSARLGAARPRFLLLLTAGVHGIESPAGNTLLRLWLAEFSANLPAELGVLLVHALNPWGFAHGRRTNENNVDLNRNAVSAFPGPVNSDYERINHWLNPALPVDAGEAFWRGALWHSLRLGTTVLRQAIATGQYEFPQGLFYGGDRRQESLEILERLLNGPELAAVEQVLHVDLHTGLGRRGEYALLVAEPPTTSSFARLTGCFGAARVVSNAPINFTHYAARGTIAAVTARALPGAHVQACTLEIGTYSSVRVLRMLRAENRLYHYGCRDANRAAALRSAFMETFCLADPGWRKILLEHGRTVFRQLPSALI
jgi:predicted deacylase